MLRLHGSVVRYTDNNMFYLASESPPLKYERLHKNYILIYSILKVLLIRFILDSSTQNISRPMVGKRRGAMVAPLRTDVQNRPRLHIRFAQSFISIN